MWDPRWGAGVTPPPWVSASGERRDGHDLEGLRIELANLLLLNARGAGREHRVPLRLQGVELGLSLGHRRGVGGLPGDCSVAIAAEDPKRVLQGAALQWVGKPASLPSP